MGGREGGEREKEEEGGRKRRGEEEEEEGTHPPSRPRPSGNSLCSLMPEFEKTKQQSFLLDLYFF